ncbi:MAG: purine-nucleoside phosphorylase [Coprothermobacter sp.]|nr:purine-nucleoside phosphorylase [Coprothermobacter sp.]
MAQFHMRFEAEDLAQHVMLVGNPQRAEQVSKLLQGARLVNEYRYLLVFTGTYEGERLSVATTGMGAPSTAIVVEELCNLGARVLLRVGSAGGVASDVDAGDIVVATGSIRDDGTSPQYLPLSFPAVPDADLLRVTMEAARDIVPMAKHGVVISSDAFYRNYDKDKMSLMMQSGVKAIEMESGCLFIVGQFRGVRTSALFAVDGSVTKDAIKPKSAEGLFKTAEEQSIRIGLSTLVRASKAGL